MVLTVGTETVSVSFSFDDEPWFEKLDEEMQHAAIKDFSDVARINALMLNAVLVNPELVPLYFRGVHGLAGMLKEENKKMEEEHGHPDV